MRLSLGLLTTLVVAESALAQSKLESKIELDPEYETCSGIKSKSQENWQKYSVGEWFVTMANAEDVYTEDIQKTVQKWEGGDSSLYGFYCTPMSNCEANFDKDECLDHNPKIYFILWAMKNFNNWMLSVSHAVSNTANVVDMMAGKLVKDFATNEEFIPTSPFGPSLAGGLFGAIASIIPAAAPVANIGAGFSTLAGGILATAGRNDKIELEPKFNDFIEVTSYIGRASEIMQTTLEEYTKSALTSIPANDRSNSEFYVDDPKSLPKIFEDGSFAAPIIADVLPDSIYISLFSAAIAHLWKDERAVVVKVDHGESYLETPPCEDEALFKDNKWCDGEGNAYLLFSWPKDSQRGTPWESSLKEELTTDLKGIDKIGDYRITIETIGKASEHAASLNGGAPYYEWDVSKVLDHLEADPANLAQFSGFNLPFCDSKGDSFGGGLNIEDCDAECQVIFKISSCFGDHSAGEGMKSLRFDSIVDKIPGVF